MVICSEPSAVRRDAALRAGASIAVNPEQDDLGSTVTRMAGGDGMDVIITAAPVPAVQSAALRLARPCGRVLLFAGLPRSRSTVELDTNLIHYKELAVLGTTASALNDCRRAAGLITRKVIDVGWMISDVMPLEGFTQAIEKVKDASSLKVVVKPARP